jgi:pimeloyl-ACP methyl ester carboxylesterase
VTIIKFLAGLLCLIAVADTMYRRFAAARIRKVFENVPPFGVVPAEFSPHARQLSIRTEDGLTLSGSLHPPLSGQTPRGLVLFCPELNGNRWMATHYCHSLLENGFAVLSFDFRNQGESECRNGYTPIHWVTEYEMKDVAGVLEFIESDPVLSTLPLAAFGVSRGGVAALAAACRYPRIRAVMADSAFGTMGMARHFVQRFGRLIVPAWVFKVLPEWHIDNTLRKAIRYSEAARNCRYVHLEREAVHLDDTSVKLISGGRDSYVTPNVASALADIFGGAEILWIVDRAKHNMARSVDPVAYDRYVKNHFEAIAQAAPAASQTQIVCESATIP